MSGRKQHFIPQAVLRGFAAGQARKSTQVYVFPRGKPPYLTATDRVAAQRDFYSPPSHEESLDDKITRYESDVLAPAIAALRDSEPGQIASHAAAAVVVHLSIRSAFVRGTFTTTAAELINHFTKALGSEEETRSLLGLDSVGADSETLKRFEGELQKVLPEGLSESDRAFAAKLVHFRSRERFAQMHSSLADQVVGQFESLLEGLPEVIGSGHGKALDQGLVPQQRVDRLAAMTWRLVEATPDFHFVLPDCLAVGSKTSDFRQLAPYALLGNDELNGVVMPVSAGKALIGCTGEPQLDLLTLNEHFARCSMDFIISSRDDETTRAAAALIGTSVSELVDELVNDTFARPAAVTAARADDGKSEPAAKVLVKFEPPARKSGKAQAVLRNLLGEPQLQEGMKLVEYVVATDDVVQSLRARGVQFVGIAAQAVMPGTCHVIEESPGLVKCQLFIPNTFANAIVRSTPAAAAASRLVRHQAGRATYYAYLTSRVAPEVWTRPAPLLTKEGLRSAQRIGSHYFGARLSLVSELPPHEVSEAVSSWQREISACAQEVERARQHLLGTKDATQAYPHAWMHAELFLTATAAALVAVSGDTVKLTTALAECAQLSEVPLNSWLTLFGRDLERYFDSRDQWKEDEDLRLLASHMERLLWGFGVLISDAGPEQVMMFSMDDGQLEGVRTALRA